MVTGDNQMVAQNVANQVGIKKIEAQVLPEQKYKIVEKYKKAGYFVAMVGDGINDSPALKSADIGIAMGNGTDIAIDSSDIVLANGSLTGLVNAINISKKTVKIIKENLFWAFFYNVITIPVAAGLFSFFGLVLTPVIASASMSLSSLIVVTNALRISRAKKSKKAKDSKEKVNFFGINNKSEHKLRKNVDVLFYNSDNDYAVKLLTKQNEEVILYKTNSQESFENLFAYITQQENNAEFGNSTLLLCTILPNTCFPLTPTASLSNISKDRPKYTCVTPPSPENDCFTSNGVSYA
jgi:hypothetical protein